MPRRLVSLLIVVLALSAGVSDAVKATIEVEEETSGFFSTIGGWFVDVWVAGANNAWVSSSVIAAVIVIISFWGWLIWGFLMRVIFKPVYVWYSTPKTVKMFVDGPDGPVPAMLVAAPSGAAILDQLDHTSPTPAGGGRNGRRKDGSNL